LCLAEELGMSDDGKYRECELGIESLMNLC
jgi:hypothetical protein